MWIISQDKKVISEQLQIKNCFVSWVPCYMSLYSCKTFFKKKKITPDQDSQQENPYESPRFIHLCKLIQSKNTELDWEEIEGETQDTKRKIIEGRPEANGSIIYNFWFLSHKVVSVADTGGASVQHA